MAANNPQMGLDKDQIFGMAEKEMEYRVDLFNNALEAIQNLGHFQKCRSSALALGPYVASPLFACAKRANAVSCSVPKWLTQTCFDKCIEKRYKESELNMGENSCIDRCVSKYWQVTNLIGQLLGSNRPPL